MAKRNPESQGRHYHMLTTLVKNLVQNGYSDIASALGDFADPAEMPGRDGRPYISDAVAWKDGVEHVFEVETHETIELDYTREQFAAFYDHARKTAGTFSIIVPKKSEFLARSVLERLEMPEVKVWTM